MSRIGRLPITVPAGVTVTTVDGLVTVKGPKGELKQSINKDMIIKEQDGVLTVDRPSDDKIHRSLHGLTRSLIANMVEGVTVGFTKTLEIVGVGYRVQKQGTKLVLSLGFSHPVEVDPPKGIELDVDGTNKIIVKGIDKQVVGAIAADIRAYRKPEPYKGKGVRYVGEIVRRKEGKTGK